MNIREDTSRDAVLIGTCEIPGWIDHEPCPRCGHSRVFHRDHDAYFCAGCNVWLESRYVDPSYDGGRERPELPIPCACQSQVKPFSLDTHLREAHEQWISGDAVKAGRFLFGRVPPAERPEWAAQVLAFAYSWSGVPSTPEIDVLLRITGDKSRWPGAHEAFLALRRVTLLVEGRDPLYEAVLILAENVGKVTYNSSGAPAPFDRDAGWWIAANVRSIADLLNQPQFESEAWSMLTPKAR